ncbi:MAG: hypothetical protein M3Q27_07870 [Actinomycetota bacterium]|nr:hypothetical protein [Actinomycetota bacterium]
MGSPISASARGTVRLRPIGLSGPWLGAQVVERVTRQEGRVLKRIVVEPQG